MPGQWVDLSERTGAALAERRRTETKVIEVIKCMLRIICGRLKVMDCDMV